MKRRLRRWGRGVHCLLSAKRLYCSRPSDWLRLYHVLTYYAWFQLMYLRINTPQQMLEIALESTECDPVICGRSSAVLCLILAYSLVAPEAHKSSSDKVGSYPALPVSTSTEHSRYIPSSIKASQSCQSGDTLQSD